MNLEFWFERRETAEILIATSGIMEKQGDRKNIFCLFKLCKAAMGHNQPWSYSKMGMPELLPPLGAAIQDQRNMIEAGYS